MNLITILGLCVIDSVFLGAFLQDPVRTLKRYGFVLTAYEYKLLKELMLKTACTDKLRRLGEFVKKLRDEDGCPVWPCPDDLNLSDFVNATPPPEAAETEPSR